MWDLNENSQCISNFEPLLMVLPSNIERAPHSMCNGVQCPVVAQRDEWGKVHLSVLFDSWELVALEVAFIA